jgi:hypothetical protein
MNRHLFLLAPALILAGCNKPPAVKAENASVADVAKQVDAARASGKFVNPGQWRTSTVMKEMTIPGMPPEASKRMQQGLNKANIAENCVTKEQAEKPNAGMFAGKDNGACRFDHFTMANGKIDGVMRCDPKEGGPPVTMTMKGTYSPDSYTMNAAMERSGPGGTMKMKLETTATRIGECKAGAE